MLASLLCSTLLFSAPGPGSVAADTLHPTPTTSPPAKVRHAERSRRSAVEYTGPVGREQHILGDDGDEDEAPADSTAHKTRRIRLGRKP